MNCDIAEPLPLVDLLNYGWLPDEGVVAVLVVVVVVVVLDVEVVVVVVVITE